MQDTDCTDSTDFLRFVLGRRILICENLCNLWIEFQKTEWGLETCRSWEWRGQETGHNKCKTGHNKCKTGHSMLF